MSQFGEPQSCKETWEVANNRWRLVLFDQQANEMEFFGPTIDEVRKAAQAGLQALFPASPNFTIAFGCAATAIFE